MRLESPVHQKVGISGECVFVVGPSQSTYMLSNCKKIVSKVTKKRKKKRTDLELTTRLHLEASVRQGVGITVMCVCRQPIAVHA